MDSAEVTANTATVSRSRDNGKILWLGPQAREWAGGFARNPERANRVVVDPVIERAVDAHAVDAGRGHRRERGLHWPGAHPAVIGLAGESTDLSCGWKSGAAQPSSVIFVTVAGFRGRRAAGSSLSRR